MNKVLYKLRRRPIVQVLIERGASMDVHIDDVWLGVNTKEDHCTLLQGTFFICQEHN